MMFILVMGFEVLIVIEVFVATLTVVVMWALHIVLR